MAPHVNRTHEGSGYTMDPSLLLGNTMSDLTEPIRRQRLAEINTDPASRGALEAKYGQVWDTHQLAEEFDVIGFLAPLVVVRRKVDGIKGSLEFQHQPRFYFNFRADKGSK